MNSVWVATFCVFLAIVTSSDVPLLGNSEVVTTTKAPPTKTTSITTVSTTTTTTTKPNTTTTANPNTTTTSTTPSQPNTTTVAPTPTSAIPTLPPQPTTPIPDLYYYNDTVDICILLETGLKFSFEFLNTTNKNETSHVDLPTANLTEISEICSGSDTLQSLKIEFFHNISATPWELDMEFILGNKMVMLSSMKLKYYLTKSIFSSLKEPVSGTGEIKNITDLYNSRLGTCAQCISDMEFPLKDSKVLKQFATNGFRVQAFRNSTTAEFGEVNQYCSADTTVNNMVPIIVGAALGALVLIVLIAYIIGRKRSQRGYESV